MLFHGGDDFIQSSSGSIKINNSDLYDVSNFVYNILLIIGMAVAVVIAAILGIKFMIGSMEEKAQIKESMLPFVVGCVVVFAAFGIWKIFVTIGSDFIK